MKLKILLFFLFSIFIVKPIFATDISILCDHNGCQKSSNLPLFSQNNIYPGFTSSQTFSINNNRDSACQLKFKTTSNSQIPDILSQKIIINISGVNYSLSDLLDSAKPALSLGSINAGAKNDYLWSVIFNKDADNEYQNLTSNFDINFNFECDEENTTPSVLGTTSKNPKKFNPWLLSPVLFSIPIYATLPKIFKIKRKHRNL